MYILKVLVDMRPERLCFKSKKDAQAFCLFAQTYYDDSGAGNGYGAYWVDLKRKPHWRPFVPANAITELDVRLVGGMLWSILSARLATEKPEPIAYACGVKDGCITFSVDQLPPRQKPSVGDMYRIPRSMMRADHAELEWAEGRVVSENEQAGLFTVRSIHHENPDGTLKKDRPMMLFAIQSSRVMKIHDWMAAMRGPGVPSVSN